MSLLQILSIPQANSSLHSSLSLQDPSYKEHSLSEHGSPHNPSFLQIKSPIHWSLFKQYPHGWSWHVIGVVGPTEGYLVGTWDAVGVTDGTVDGDNVGALDGALVLGSSLGEMVGFDDTNGDGLIDGDMVGLEGLFVGLNDGSNVG